MIKRYCNHCGEEIPETKRYFQLEIDIEKHCNDWAEDEPSLRPDLCPECYEKLLDFLKGKNND